ncbi:hypothetical protein LXL04_030098 [Taraxacum kok-saghyz]
MVHSMLETEAGIVAQSKSPYLIDFEPLDPFILDSLGLGMGEPDEDGRRKIFGLYLKEVPMEEDKKVICDIVASRTRGLVGVDLENITHESVLLAARRDGDFVTKEDVLQAVERATKKICNVDDSATKGKSLYSFAQMTQESMHFWSGYKNT